MQVNGLDFLFAFFFFFLCEAEWGGIDGEALAVVFVKVVITS